MDEVARGLGPCTGVDIANSASLHIDHMMRVATRDGLVAMCSRKLDCIFRNMPAENVIEERHALGVPRNVHV